MLTPTNVTSAQFNAAALANAVSHIRMTFTGQNITLTDDDIESSGLQLNQYMNSDTDLTFGKTAMYNLSVNILNSSNLTGIAWDGEFKLEIGLEVNNSTEWITIGYFTGERPEKVTNVEVISFRASDRMQKFDVIADDWISSLTFPKTVKQLYDSLCSYVGVSNESGNELANIMSRSYSSCPIQTSGLTCRKILGLIAEAAGCYAKIAANGKCKLVWFSNQTSYTITGDQEFSSDAFDVALADVDSITKVKALNVKQTEDDVGVIVPQSESKNVYLIVDNPFLTSSSASDTTNYITPIYTRLANFGGYLPSTVECIGNVLVEAGDIITVDINGQSVPMPIFTRLLIWKGHCVDKYEATGNMKRRNVTEENKEKLSTGGRYHKFRTDIDGLYSELYDPVTGDINIINSSLGNITLSVSKKARIYYASTAPAGTVSDPLVTGDLWIDTGHSNQLKRWNGSSWADASFDDPDKYTVRSGVDINANGVEITGSKYLKLYSGGVLDIQTTNFTISSANKKLASDVWTIDPSGIRMEDTENSDAFQIKTYGNTGHAPVVNLDSTYDKFVGIRASYAQNEPVRLILEASDSSVQNNQKAGVSISRQGLYPPGQSIIRPYAVFEPHSSNIAYGTILGTSSNPFSILFSNNIYGNCAQNNLTVTADGYVLDARQGKILKDTLEFLSFDGINATTLSSAFDFNDYVNRGTYVTPSDAIMASCANRPINMAGRFMVFSILSNNEKISGNQWNYGIQIYMDYEGNIYVRDSRTGYGTTPSFSSWKRFMRSNDFQTKTYSYSYTVGGGASISLTGTNFGVSTPSGYTPMAVLHYATGLDSVYINKLDGTGTGSNTVMRVKNTSSAQQSSTASITILYIKT